MKNEIVKEMTDLHARLEVIAGEQALIAKRLDELFMMLVNEVEAEVKETELEEEPEDEDEGEDVVSAILNGPMNDELQRLLTVASFVKTEKPKDPPTEELIATPEEAKAAEEALGKKEEAAPRPSRPKAKISAMSRLSAKKAEPKQDEEEEDLIFIVGGDQDDDPDENGEYPDPDD